MTRGRLRRFAITPDDDAPTYQIWQVANSPVS
jgi:hypothetical protein